LPQGFGNSFDLARCGVLWINAQHHREQRYKEFR
jgi:hypothetical protein